MRRIPRKLIVDEHGNPVEVIISWEEFQEIEEVLGLDLDAAAIDDLRQARRDREAHNADAFLDLEAI